jgi:phosphoglycerol transferase MdoB-like AlkP superfamily enzyme
MILNAKNEGKEKTFSQLFFSLSITLLFLILLMRLYELLLIMAKTNGQSNNLKYELQGFLYDFVLFFRLAGFLFIPFILLYQLKPTLSKYFFIGVSLLVVFSSFCLSSYFSESKSPFGAELFGYSANEMSFTIHASGWWSWFTLVVATSFLAVTLLSILRSDTINISRRGSNLFCWILLLGFVLACFAPSASKSKSPYEGFLTANKLLFFINSSGSYFQKQVFSKNENTSVDTLNGSKESTMEYVSKEFPFLHKDTSKNILGDYFYACDSLPNFIFIIVEGLGRAYSGRNAYLGSFTPFLDSLGYKGLYWENMLSTSGRTFCALPSIFGSLPFGKNGFAEMGSKMPNHFTLLQLLKERGYQTSFYCGTDPHFDNMDTFLNRQKIDHIVGINQFETHYSKLPAMKSGFSWGYGDKEIFNKYVSDYSLPEKAPRLDIILTIATHEPFLLPNQEYYLNKFKNHLNALIIKEDQKVYNRQYAHEFASLIYFDDALRAFFNNYSHNSKFKNTIFVITGDHRMPEIPISTQLDRFHVPLIIWSPRIKKPAIFKSVSSHFDITPSILAFLRDDYKMNFPKHVAWVGQGLSIGTSFKNTAGYPLMRNKSEFIDYVSKEDFISGNALFKIYQTMDIENYEDEKRQVEVENQFSRFKVNNAFACANNRLIPDSLISKKIK